MLNSWTSHLSAITWDSLGSMTKGRCSPIICWRCVRWGGVALFLCLLLCVFGRSSSPLCLASSQLNVSESEMFHLTKNGKHGSTVSLSARGLSIGNFGCAVRTCRTDFLFSLPVHVKLSWFRPRMDPFWGAATSLNLGQPVTMTTFSPSVKPVLHNTAGEMSAISF